MPVRSLALFGLTAATFVLACDRAPMTEELPVATVIVVTGSDSSAVLATPVARVTDRTIIGPTAKGMMPGMAPQGDPTLTLFDATASRQVTLAPVVGSPNKKGWATPTMNLFGSAAQPWRVQVGPRMDLGRNSGLMLRGGTQGQHNRWDLGASATVGGRPNVQGVVRYHP